jgi:L-alanine-DL-glutamate epimerase-like enolase superfamily enzyme
MAPDVDAVKMWRALEAEALAFAEQITDPEAKLSMLMIAQGYRRLAEHAEKRGKPENGE